MSSETWKVLFFVRRYELAEVIKLFLEKIFSLGIKKNLFSILIGLIVMFYVIVKDLFNSVFLATLLAIIIYIICVLILSFLDYLFTSYKYLLQKENDAENEENKRKIGFLQNLSSIEEQRLENFIKNGNKPEPYFEMNFSISGHHVVDRGESIPKDFFEIVDLPREIKEVTYNNKVISTRKGKALKPEIYEMFSQIWPVWEQVKLQQKLYYY